MALISHFLFYLKAFKWGSHQWMKPESYRDNNLARANLHFHAAQNRRRAVVACVCVFCLQVMGINNLDFQWKDKHRLKQPRVERKDITSLSPVRWYYFPCASVKVDQLDLYCQLNQLVIGFLLAHGATLWRVSATPRGEQRRAELSAKPVGSEARMSFPLRKTFRGIPVFFFFSDNDIQFW